MGVYSELDMERRCGEEPFESGVPGFEDETVPAAFGEDTPSTPIDPKPSEETPRAETPGGAAKEAKAAAEPEDEDAKRKAHEAAEAKRKAEFDAKQAAKKAAEQEQMTRLATMGDEEVIAASMKRVNEDTEKLTRRNMKECVAEYIQTMCIEDPAFARKTMHPRKSMIRCFQYINRKAWDYVQDELKASGTQPGPGQQGYGSDVPDDLCYQWAVDYFNDPDAKEDHEDDEEFVPKPYYGGGRKSTPKAKKEKKAAEKPAAPKPAPKPKETDNQLSLLDMAS